MRARLSQSGFTLAELLIATAMGAFLITGVLSLAQATTAAFRLQQALGQMQENARFIASTIEPAIRQAGYHPQPWRAGQPGPAIAAGTMDGFNSAGDRIVLRRWSDRNCFDNANTELDANGQPRHFLLETGFHANDGGQLVHRCRYGADADSLVTQVNNLGLVEGVAALQVQYAEDSDGDSFADRWVGAGQWQSEDRLTGVRVSLLLASPFPVGGTQPRRFQLLDELVDVPADGRLRRAFHSAAAIRGRLK